MTKHELRELSNNDIAERLFMLADKMNNMYGKNPDADLVREAGTRYWTDAKADEEASPKPKAPVKRKTTRKA